MESEARSRKGRSPNCPSLSLSEAIQKVDQIYQAEHTHATSREVIAKDIGYQGINGASLTAIGALRQYGLLAEKDGNLVVSDDAVALLVLPKGDKERDLALSRRAFAPHLFAEMRQEYGDTLPSEASLRHWLIKKKFLPKAADSAIRVYRENLELVKDAIRVYDDHGGGEMSPPKKDGEGQMTETGSGAVRTQSGGTGVVSPQTRLFSWPLSKGVTAEVKLTGSGLSATHIDMLSKYLEIAKEALEAEDSEPDQ